MASAVSTYLRNIERALAEGNATEHTHRPALKMLIEAIEPGVTATNEPTHVECGAPDLLVSRNGVTVGYVETKEVGKSLAEVERSEQLRRYRGALSNLILTDYLEFRWYVDGERRQTVRLGSATGEGKITRSRSGGRAVADLFRQFFAQQPPAIGRPDELANRMAGLARMIRDLIRETFARETERGRLHAQLKAFRDTLIPDLAPDQFADMYAQTITYGLFAARVRVGSGQAFTRQSAAWNLPETNPFLRSLFNEIAGPGLDPRIAWLVDDLARLLARADMVEILQDFGRRTRQEDPVVHFYETFLGAYDPKTRRTRGVYYTPEPVVSYIVRSLDHILKTRFDRPMGLADTNTLVLDPACGTGTFLYFVIRRIHEALSDRRQLGAWNGYVEKHLLPRIFGFELLMAPYTVAHMKLSILLRETGYGFASDQRLGIYLTNTLEEAVTQAETLGFAGFITEEGNAAAEIKRDKPIMVVLGNPPYAGHSANRSWEIRDGKRVRNFIGKLVRDYYRVDGKPLGERNPKWLQDDYVKFIRWGQWRIERTGAGILAFITNHGYLDNPTFRGMRQSLMQTFDDIYILDLHGSAIKRERCPDGSRDQNVFDIPPGVAIGIFVRSPGAGGRRARVQHAHLWGLREVWEERPSGERVLCGGKYHWLLGHDLAMTDWTPIEPRSPFYLFVRHDTQLLTEYERGWKVTDVMPVYSLGILSKRDSLVVGFDRRELLRRIRAFVDPRLSHRDSADRFRLPMRDRDRWDIAKVRSSLMERVSPEHIMLLMYRPMDLRFVYYDDELIARPNRRVMRHLLRPNRAIIVGRQGQATGSGVWDVLFVCAELVDQNIYRRGGGTVFPLYLYTTPEDNEGTLFAVEEVTREPNLSPKFIAELERRLGMGFVPDGKGDLETSFGPEDVFNYIYALLHSPTYRRRYAEFLKIDFPQVPLTTDRDLFAALADRGQELVGLHLMESPLLHQLVTSFSVGDSNQVERVRYTEPCLDDDGNQVAGRVYINKTQYFEGVPPEVWECRVGGYQVCRKWLRDRRRRQLSFDDLLHYQKIVVALRETIRLMAEIDQVIDAHGVWPIE